MLYDWQRPYEGETVTIDPEWTPDESHINALPAPLRNFIHELLTDADPADTIRQNVLLRDQNEALRRLIRERST